MTLQNRVTPDGDIIADAARGTMMGNRGILHDENQILGKARWRHANWVACRLEFNNRHRRIMAPRRYTELFFLDEAVAFAAGHRPCGECRRSDYLAFKVAWARHNGGQVLAAKDLDRALHAERVIARRRQQKRFQENLAALPAGAFVLLSDDQFHEQPFLVLADSLLPYSPSGYGVPIKRLKNAAVTVLTPPGTLNAFRAGYVPTLHPSAII
jgi:hypothetical protein